MVPAALRVCVLLLGPVAQRPRNRPPAEQVVPACGGALVALPAFALL